MNETIRTIKNRYSCRGFTDQKVPENIIEEIALAGLAAPSSNNIQPWKIVVIKNKQLLEEVDQYIVQQIKDMYKDVYDKFVERGGKIFYNSQLMYTVLMEKNQIETAPLDCGIVVENMALAASSLGLGNVICGFAKLAFSGEMGEKLKLKLNIPQSYDFATSLLVGYCNTQKTPHDPDLSKVSYYD